MRCHEIKLVKSLDTVETLETVALKVRKHLENPMQYNRIEIGNVSLGAVRVNLELEFDCSVREGVTGGCYGARDGSSFEGVTVWMDASVLPDRVVDEGTEYVNIDSLISEYGGELVDGLDGDEFETACDSLGLEVKRNNTYNYAGQSSDEASFMFDADFAVISSDDGDAAYLSIKYHCGGDIRGNYTSKAVFKFDSIDDIHGVLYPMLRLLDEESIA